MPRHTHAAELYDGGRFHDGWDAATVSTYVEAITTGSKPVAAIFTQQGRVEGILDVVAQASKEVKNLVCPESEGWATVYLFRYPHLLDVLLYQQKCIMDLPMPVREWLTGCLFGYSQSDIAAHIASLLQEAKED